MSNEGIVMSDRENKLPDAVIVAAMLKAKSIGVKMLASDCEAILGAALEHCKQGDPVAWRRWEVDHWVYYETKAWDDLTPLFAHAMPKSEDKPVRMFNMQNPPIPIPWHLAEALYAVYSDVYRKEQSLEKMHSRGGFGWGEISVLMKDNPRTKKVLQEFLEKNPIPEYFTTPQPTTDISELVKALELAREKLQIECGGVREYKGGIQSQVLFPMLDALIAKHTVKA
jgi:hypothetical protein